MKTQIAIIYHCTICGRVVHSELDSELPQCCGHVMANAVTETTSEGDAVGKRGGDDSETAQPVIEDRKKPR
jgi:hypothetical protein